MNLLPLALLLVACSTAAPTPSHTPSPAPSPTPSPTPRLGIGEVTFRVGEEEYRILITDVADLDIAQQLLDGEEAPGIPNGKIVRGVTSVNEGWSWSIDPATLEFADVTTEVCDGLPSYVEDGSLTGEYFCPWSAEVIDVVTYTTTP
jgi:hypothetical protein